MDVQKESKVYTKNNGYAFTAQLLSAPDSVEGWLIDEITEANYLLGYATGNTFPDKKDGGIFIEFTYTVDSTGWIPDVKIVYVKDLFVNVIPPTTIGIGKPDTTKKPTPKTPDPKPTTPEDKTPKYPPIEEPEPKPNYWLIGGLIGGGVILLILLVLALSSSPNGNKTSKPKAVVSKK